MGSIYISVESITLFKTFACNFHCKCQLRTGKKTGILSVKLYKNAYVTHTFQHDVKGDKSVSIIT